MAGEYIEDYATGKRLRRTPEEPFRQQFERILIDDLGYPREHLEIEFPIQRGSNRRAEMADVIVFHSSKKSQDNAYMVIEIERPGKPYDHQALSYATATTAPFSIWFSGLERDSKGPFFLYRDLAVDAVRFYEIPSLPRYGETVETIGKYRKTDLKPARGLKVLFERMHHKLYGSGPLKKEESVAQEVIKLLFCKIIDELRPDELCQFRATPSEQIKESGQKEVALRIQKLFTEVKQDPAYQELFKGEVLEYPPFWITYVVSELQGIGLLHPQTNTDAMGDAYEVFLPANLKGERGQFFTPRPVVRLAIGIISPGYNKKEAICDPACGSAGFLTVALEHIRHEIESLYKDRKFSPERKAELARTWAEKYCFGIEIEPLLYRIAKSYMAIIGDGKSNIFREDSLLPFSKWAPGLSERVKPGMFDVVMTNPPFGTKIDDTRQDVLAEYELGHRLVNGEPTEELLAGQDPDKLFLERDIRLLRDASGKSGGRMVIVLPRQNLSGSEQASRELRRWLLNRVRITAVIDLPREAFQPHTGTKTSLLFVEKVRSPEENNDIFMAVSESIGHDRRGNPIYRKDDGGNFIKNEKGEYVLWDDTEQILDAWSKYKRGEAFEMARPSVFAMRRADILAGGDILRLDAGFYDPNKNELFKRLEELESGHRTSDSRILSIERIGDVVLQPKGVFYPGRHRRNYVPSSRGAVEFLSGSQILQAHPTDVKFQPRAYVPMRNHFVEQGWILVTRSGTTGRAVYVTSPMAGKAVSEHVIRIIPDTSKIHPGYLYSCLASQHFGRLLLNKGIYASVVDHITPEFIETLPIPRLGPDEESKIGDMIIAQEEYRAAATATILEGLAGFEADILGALGIQDTELAVSAEDEE